MLLAGLDNKGCSLLKSARIPFINELHQDSLNMSQRGNLWLQEEDISSIPDKLKGAHTSMLILASFCCCNSAVVSSIPASTHSIHTMNMVNE